MKHVRNFIATVGEGVSERASLQKGGGAHPRASWGNSNRPYHKFPSLGNHLVRKGMDLITQLLKLPGVSCQLEGGVKPLQYGTAGIRNSGYRMVHVVPM